MDPPEFEILLTTDGVSGSKVSADPLQAPRNPFWKPIVSYPQLAASITLEAITQLMPGAGPPLTTMPNFPDSEVIVCSIAAT